jgi:serine/threonine protein kinase
MFQKELNVLQMLHHQNIIQLVDFLHDQQKFYLVMEYYIFLIFFENKKESEINK